MSDDNKPLTAAVREAMENLALTLRLLGDSPPERVCIPVPWLSTLLSYVRAAQSPRLTDAQVAALHIAQLRCLEEGNLADVVEILESTFPAAFPGLFGEEG